MIRACATEDFDVVLEIINEAALKYRGAIPPDCWREPYMPREDLRSEMEHGVRFSCWEEGGVAGVMGLQRVRDVMLIRHAYVRTSHQGKGIGSALLTWLRAQTQTPVLIGTWAAATWAIRFYERHGFELVSGVEKDRLLTTYWHIPDRQREVSVVLRQRSG